MAFFQFPLAIYYLSTFVFFPLFAFPLPFIRVLVRLGHIALLLFSIPVICEVSISLAFCGQWWIVMYITARYQQLGMNR